MINKASMQGSPSPSPGGIKPSRRQEWGKYILITVGLGFLGLVVVLPLLAVFYRAFSAGWDPFWQGITDPNAIHAMGLTLRVAAVAVPINTAFGILMAWILARHRFPGKALVLNLLDLPLAISPVIGGLMFILLYSPRFGLLEGMVNQLNWRIVFAYPGILLTTMFVTLPFVVREVLPALQNLAPEEEEAAQTLGARGWTVFWRVTFPNIRWAVLYGVILCASRAIGEFGAVSVISGKLIGQTNTLTLHIEQSYAEFDTVAAYACACLMAGIALVSLIAQAILHQFDGGKTN